MAVQVTRNSHDAASWHRKRQVLASAPLRALLHGRPVIPEWPVLTDSLLYRFASAAGPTLRLDLHLRPCPPSASTLV